MLTPKISFINLLTRFVCLSVVGHISVEDSCSGVRPGNSWLIIDIFANKQFLEFWNLSQKSRWVWNEWGIWRGRIENVQFCWDWSKIDWDTDMLELLPFFKTPCSMTNILSQDQDNSSYWFCYWNQEQWHTSPTSKTENHDPLVSQTKLRILDTVS